MEKFTERALDWCVRICLLLILAIVAFFIVVWLMCYQIEDAARLLPLFPEITFLGWVQCAY